MRQEWSVKLYPENIKGADHMEDIDVDGRVILKLITSIINQQLHLRDFHIKHFKNT